MQVPALVKTAGLLLTATSTAIGLIASIFGIFDGSKAKVVGFIDSTERGHLAMAAGLTGLLLAWLVTRWLLNKRHTHAYRNFHKLAHETRDAKLLLNNITDKELEKLGNVSYDNWNKAYDDYYRTMRRAVMSRCHKNVNLLVRHLDKVHKQTSHRAFLHLVEATGNQHDGDIYRAEQRDLQVALFSADESTQAHVSEKHPGERFQPVPADQDSAIAHLCGGPHTHYYAPKLSKSALAGAYRSITEAHEQGYASKVVVPIRRPIHPNVTPREHVVHGYLTVLFKRTHRGINIPVHPPNQTADELSPVLATIASHADSLATVLDEYKREAYRHDEAWVTRRAQLGVIDRRNRTGARHVEAENKANHRGEPVYFSQKISALARDDSLVAQIAALGKRQSSRSKSSIFDDKDFKLLMKLAKRLKLDLSQFEDVQIIDFGKL